VLKNDCLVSSPTLCEGHKRKSETLHSIFNLGHFSQIKAIRYAGGGLFQPETIKGDTTLPCVYQAQVYCGMVNVF